MTAFGVPLEDERIHLGAFIEDYRRAVDAALSGLTEEQARRSLVRSATTLLSITTLPPSVIRGRSRTVSRKGARTLTASCRSIAAASVSSRPMNSATPALLTSTSSGRSPSARPVSATSRSTPSAVARSAPTATAPPPTSPRRSAPPSALSWA